MGTFLVFGERRCRARATFNVSQVVALAVVACLQACTPQASPPEAGKAASQTPSPTPESPAAYRGAAIASHVCAQCHEVSTPGGPGQAVSAPTFISVANRPETTAQSLSTWLTSSHPTMPNYIFSKASVDDIVAYLTTLKQAPQKNPN